MLPFDPYFVAGVSTRKLNIKMHFVLYLKGSWIVLVFSYLCKQRMLFMSYYYINQIHILDQTERILANINKYLDSIFQI